MKKLLAVIIGLVLMLAAAVVFLPQVIDWNEYRGEIARRAEMLTGRQMVIGGDISVALLPAPALVAKDVRMSNLRGAVAPQMLQLKSLEIRVALGPLLGGDVQVETVKMVDPVIELERLADGSVNWRFTPVERRDGSGVTVPLTGVAPAPESGEGMASSVRLDSFLIENGTVVFRDSKQGLTERVEDLNARLAADSLGGPYDSAGDLTYRGVPLSYEVSLGRVVEGRTLPMNLILRAEPGDTEAQFSGAVLDLAESPRVSGKMIASGETLSKLIDDLFGAGTAPAPLKKPFRMEGELTASADGIETEDLTLTLGPVRATGGARVDFTSPVNVDLSLSANRIDLDSLMTAEPEPAPGQEGGPGDDGQEDPAGDKKEPAPAKAARAGESGFAIPENLTGVFDFSVAALTFSGSNISEARINAEISGGEITISQLSALLPGGSDLFATGFLSAEAGQPKFDGDIDLKISDLRRVFAWLGIQPPAVPSDRLRKAALKGRIVADASQIQGRNLDVAIDTSRITGGVTLALRKKLAFGANFKVDRLNLDAYIADGRPASGRGTRAPLETGGGSDKSDPQAATADNPLQVLGFLNRFDANLKLRIERMTYRRVPFNQVAFDGTLFGGNLEVRDATVGDLVGARGKISGSLVGLTQVPGVRNLHFELTEIDPVRLSRLFEVDAPFTSNDVGKVSLTGRAEGTLLQPEFDLILKARDTSIDLGGRLSILPVNPLFDGDMRIRHADFPQFLRLLGLTYRPTGRLGGFGLSARVKGDLSKATFEGLSGRIGPVTLNGGLTLDRTGPRPRLTAELNTGRIPVDQFLPADGRAARLPGAPGRHGGPRIMPAVWRSGEANGGDVIRIATEGAPDWPVDPLDLSALQSIDADLKLNSEAISYEAITLTGAVADVSITNGVLRANSLTGGLFGGRFKGIASVFSEPVPSINGSLSVSGADLTAAELAVTGRRKISGTGDFRVTFDSSGRSIAGLVAGLGGDGSFELKKVEMAKEPTGAGMGPIGGLISGLNDLVGIIGGRGAGSGLADISAGFKMTDGVAHTEDLAFVTNAGTGDGRGDVWLPDWRMKITGDIQLSQNLLSKLLSGTTGMAITIPYRIEGPLDDPGTFIDTGKLPGKALSIPGEIIDRTGLGDVLRRINPLAR
ncbi:MAG: AsmA family protein [Rhodospirillales bacterium]|nr:AsmA family protein [Rhodospirillales bacterium]